MSDILAPPEPGDLTRPLPGDPSKPYNPPLSKASVEGRLEDVKKMVNSGQHDINEIDVGWSTPLHRACWEGHAEIVKFLLDAKADVTMINIVSPLLLGTFPAYDVGVPDSTPWSMLPGFL